MDPGVVLRRARRRAGLSQRDLARKARVPQSTVARIESGLIDPRASTLDELLAHCGEELAALPRIGVGVDRTLIASTIALSPRQRLRNLATYAKFFARIEGRSRKPKRR